MEAHRPRKRHAGRSGAAFPCRGASPITSHSTRTGSADPSRKRVPSLRVEMVLPTLAAAGMEVMVANLTRGLARRGDDVGVTCLEADGPIGDELRADGFRVAVVRSPGFRGVLRPVRLEAWLRDVRPDVVHAHSGGGVKGVRAAR